MVDWRPLPVQPIVPGATFTVSCACGFAHDSAAETAELALAEVARAHEPTHDLTVRPC